MNAGCITTSLDIDDFVLAYESAYATGEATDIASFFPPPDHPRRSEGIIELLRVDLEYAWRDGNRDRLEHQVAQFSALVDRRELAELAYEDFRLRRAAGENVSRATYSQRFEIDTSGWPELPVGVQPADESPAGGLQAEPSWLSEISLSAPALAARLERAGRKMPDVGQNFEGFELVAELGRGAFGRVFLARQRTLANRTVALKITPQWSDEPQHLAQLQHTNIVPIYSLHQREPLQAICMPYLGASTLADVLRERKQSSSAPLSGKLFETTIRARHATTIGRRLDRDSESTEEAGDHLSKEGSPVALKRLSRMNYLDAVVRTMARVTEGLAYAHDHGVVHRDLKPANVLIGDDGQPLILDFHIAAQASSSSPAVAAAGGTLPYMAPESLQALLTSSGDGDARSDIYSIGVILYELLTGSRPFVTSRGPVEAVVPKIVADRKTPPKSPRLLNPGVSPGLAAIVLKCLALEPAERYATAHELHEDLQRHIEHRPLRYAKDRSAVERASKWATRHPRLSSATSVSLLSLGLLIAIASALMLRGSQLEAIQARESMRTFREAAADAAAVLDIPGVDDQALDDAVAAAEEALKPYAIGDGKQWQKQELARRLNRADRTQLATELSSLTYLLAAGQSQQALYAATKAERTRLLDVALETNRLAESIHPGDGVPQAFALQRKRFELAREDAPRSAYKKIAMAPVGDLPSSFEDRYLLAVELAHSRQWREAAGILQQLIRARPQDYKLWRGMGACYLERKEFADAEACFSAAITLDPEHFISYLYRSVCRLNLNRPGAAIDDCNAVISRKAVPGAYINRALARHASGQTQLAIEDLATALRMGSKETRVYFLRAKWRQALGDALGAATDRAAGLNRTPRDEKSWVARAVARFDDDPEAALADCEEALYLNPISHSALHNMAFLYGEKLSQPDMAIASLSRLLEVAPRNAKFVASRGVYYARTNQRDAAVADAAAALRLNDDAMTHYRAACIYTITSKQEPGDVAKAMDAFATALSKQPGLVSLAQDDPDLDFLRTNSRFSELVEAALRLQSPPPSSRKGSNYSVAPIES